METTGEEESETNKEITPKEYPVDHMDYKGIEEMSKLDQIMDSKGIKQTSMESQGFLDQTPKTMMNDEVEERKQGVGCFEQFQVQSLELQVTTEVHDEVLVKTLQYQIMKGNCEVNKMV